MIDLSTTYMGLNLKNPIIIGSSGLTHSTEDIKKLEENGAGAVVLKSIFEEQILMEGKSLDAHHHMPHAEAEDYIRHYTRQHNLDGYLKLIKETKKAVSIPVIASINCISASEWTSFGKKIQDAGADGLELNMFIMPADYEKKGEDIEQIYFDIVNEVRNRVSLPLGIKISSYFSGLANMIFNLSVRKVDAIVLFNRFFKPDIDLEKMQIIAADVYSSPSEICRPLQWIGMLSGKVKCDLAASTGIHSGHCVLKNVLAGAKAVQIASAIYRNGPEHIGKMLDQMTKWMKQHYYTSINEITGKLSQKHIKDPALYERAQFMKYFAAAK